MIVIYYCNNIAKEYRTMDVKSVSRELWFYFSLTRRFNILMNIIITILLPGHVSALSKHLKMSNYITKVRVVGARDRVLLLPFLSFSYTFCISSPRSFGGVSIFCFFFFILRRISDHSLRKSPWERSRKIVLGGKSITRYPFHELGRLSSWNTIRVGGNKK